MAVQEAGLRAAPDPVGLVMATLRTDCPNAAAVGRTMISKLMVLLAGSGGCRVIWQVNNKPLATSPEGVQDAADSPPPDTGLADTNSMLGAN